MKNLKIKIGGKKFWIVVIAIGLLFLAFVLADAPNPGHLGSEILVDVPANAVCASAGQMDVPLQQAINERCLMDDGEDFVPVVGGLCRICKSSCGSSWTIEVGMITTYGGSQGTSDGDRFGTGKYRYYPSGCAGSLSGEDDLDWGEGKLKVCCASA